MVMKTMGWKKISLTCAAFACAATSLTPCWAEPDSQARGQVFSREFSGRERLEFEWDSHQRVPFSIEHDGNEVTLYFEKPVALRWKSSLKAIHPYIKKVDTEDGGATVVLTLSQPTKVQYYRHNDFNDSAQEVNGLDLVKIPHAAKTKPTATLETPVDELPEPVMKPAARMTPAQKKHLAAEKAKARQAWLAKVAKRKEAARLANLAPAAGSVALPPTAALAATTSTETPAAATPPTAEAAPVVAAPAETPTVPATVAPAVSTPAAAQATSPTPTPATTAADSAILPLPYAPTDAFAAFAWQKKLWIVSENPAPLAVQDIQKAAGTLGGDVQKLADEHASIYSMPLAAGVSAVVEKSADNHTQILLQHAEAKPARDLAFAVNGGNGQKISVTVAATGAQHTIALHDPLTGYMLNVTPVPEPGAGVATPRSFVEFNLLPTAQGVAVQVLSDDVTVKANKDGVEIDSAGGLAISPELARQLKESASDAKLANLPPTLFPYARWKLEDEKDFVPRQLDLYHEIAFSAPDAANKGRLKLLGLYLGEGLFAESVQMADDILRSNLKFYEANKVSALRGAAHFFMYRINEAARDFSAAELAGDPEAQMWLTLCKELLGEGTDKFDFVGNYERYIRYYPPSFVGKLAVIAADRSINRRQYEAANTIFDLLKRDDFDTPVKKYITYMQGKIFSETHGEAEAAKIWEEQAKDLGDPLIRARADFSLINMRLREGKMSHTEAARKLEKLRIVWRGDALELNVLTLLSGLYVRDKQYDKALYTMRDIVMYYPQVPEAVTTARQMEQIFVNLYNKGNADVMPPLDALALFYEFRDLVPIGPEGDQMIRNLADRLVNIDLLDRATQLLDHQIRNRLQGEERSRVGVHLAHIHLLNHKPEEALEVLKTTGYGDLPADLQLGRLRLTAQALAQQGKVARAIEVISSDTSTEGTILRLSIYWDNKDWPNVVTIAEDILGSRNDPSAPLTPAESDTLLKLATAYVFEHDTGQLQYLRDYFTPLMKNNPNRASFQFITSESGNVNYDNLANLDQDIGAIKSFLASNPQEKPGKNGLSPKLAN